MGLVIMNKHSSSRQRLGGSLLTYIYIGVGVVVSLVYTPVMLNLMGKSEFGIYTIALSVVGYLRILDFGLNSAYIKFYSTYVHDKDDQGLAVLNGMYLVVFSLLGIAAFTAAIILAMNVSDVFGNKLTSTEQERLQVALLILAVTTAFSLPFGVFNSHILAKEQFIISKLILILKQLLNPMLALPLLLLGYGSIGGVIATLAVTIICGVLGVLFCFVKLDMKFSFSRMDFRVLKKLFTFSFFIFINLLVNQINWHVGKLLLGIYKGTADTAVFGLACTINIHYLTFSTAISSMYLPKVNKLVASNTPKETIDRLFLRISRMQFLVVIFILSTFIAIGSPFILLFWGGKAYEGAYLIACILMVSETIPLTQNLGIEIQRAMNKHQFRSILYLIIALINLVVSIPLCIRFGGVGCAIGTAAGQVLGNTLIINWYYQRKLKLDIVSYWKQVPGTIIPRLALPILLCGGILFMDISSVPMFFVACIAICFAFAISIYAFVLSKDERARIIGSVCRRWSNH